MDNKPQNKHNHLSLSIKTVEKVLSAMLLLIVFNSPLLAEDSSDSSLSSDDTSTSLPPLPDLPPIPQDDEQLSSVASIRIEKFVFEGNHVFSDEQLTAIAQPYQGHTISAEELQEVKNKITSHYIEAGYINSGAIIPDQKVTDGIVTIKIIEGKLFQVEVSGNGKLHSSYIQKRLEGKKGDALDINKLQERLQLLQQNQRIDRINAELGPGVRLGEGILKIDVKENEPYEVQFSFNNHRSPSVGAYRGELEGWHYNVTSLLFDKGWGDTFYLRYGLTEGLKDYTVRYDIPINHHDTTLSFNVERSDSEVVEFPFDQLDVESEANTYAVALRHPLFKKPTWSLDLALRLEKRTSKTFLLGQPFSFSPGVRDGESDLSVIRFSQDGLLRDTSKVIAVRSSFNFGIDALNSTINEDGSPDSQFFTWLGQFQFVKRLDFFSNERFKNSQIIFRTDFQWANEELLPLEKLSIGGASTVRGYRENLLTRDRGLISSLEWRIPVVHLPIPEWSKNPEDGWLQIAFFVDYGRAWNAGGDNLDLDDDITSVGLGLRWSPLQHIRTQLYWGYALHDVPDPDDKDLQDNGIHFEIQIQWPF